MWVYNSLHSNCFMWTTRKQKKYCPQPGWGCWNCNRNGTDLARFPWQWKQMSQEPHDMGKIMLNYSINTAPFDF